MAEDRFAILDPCSGISGDMLLGALVDAGAPPGWVSELPARLGLPDVQVRVERVARAGVAATKVTVVLPGEVVEGPADVGHHHHGAQAHAHAHGGAPHRHVGELLGMVERAPVSSWVRERAARAFRLLGEAEGRIHGLPAEEVALHEVGALDALVDIVGGVEGFERIGVREVYNRPVALGSGWVRAAHGTIPVPAPATALLLEGVEVSGAGPVTGEATTPTGAALLRALSSGPPPARWRQVATGWGAGTRDPVGYPNALRVLVAVPAAEAGQVVTLATDLDDLSPEYLDPLREALTAAGALDVQIWSTQMKKGRTGFRVETLAAHDRVDAVTEALFRHSTTGGLRRWTAERVTLPRREVRVEVDGVQIRVKVLEGPGGIRVKPEFDDLAALARATGRPVNDLAQQARQRALEHLAAGREQS